MSDFLTVVSKFWFLIAGSISFIFTLGVIWQRTQTSINGVKKLFTVVDKLNGFMEAQVTHNEYFKEHAKLVGEKLIEHNREDEKKFSEMMVRIDQIYNLLSGRNQ